MTEADAGQQTNGHASEMPDVRFAPEAAKQLTNYEYRLSGHFRSVAIQMARDEGHGPLTVVRLRHLAGACETMVPHVSRNARRASAVLYLLAGACLGACTAALYPTLGTWMPATMFALIMGVGGVGLAVLAVYLGLR